MINPTLIYENSYLHFSNSKIIKIEDTEYNILIYLLDKRFVITKQDNLKKYFNYCKVIDLDSYYYKILSSYPIDKHRKFIELLSNDIIINISDFIKILE